jgi:O-antigen chain-terminating methyltransferase
MTVPSAHLDLDQLIAAIRREAALRGDPAPFDARISVRQQEDRGSRSGRPALPSRCTTLRQFMPFHGPLFVVSAYHTILRRAPDNEGLKQFTMALAEGRMTRWEVLGRMRLSAEGRQRRERLPGLWPAVALSVAYRIPLVGPMLALVARVLCVPAHMQDLARDDRVIAQMLAAGS